MIRYVIFYVIFSAAIALILCSCPQQEPLSTETGVALGGGGEVTPEATTPVERKCLGPDSPEWAWKYTLPAEAEITSSIGGLPNRNVGRAVIGYDGTVYFTAWALPDAKQDIEFMEDNREASFNDQDLGLEVGARSIRVSWLAKHAPKQAWLIAISPDGEFKWVFKAPGGPVGHPMLTTDGNIVIGTYGIHAANYHPNRTDADDPREHCGGIYVIRPNGELLNELDPGGWLDSVRLNPGGTLICRVSETGDEWINENLKDILCLEPNLEPPPYRYVAINLEGEVLWEYPEDSFDVIDTDFNSNLLVDRTDCVWEVDAISGESLARFVSRIPDAYPCEYSAAGAVYWEDSDGEVINRLVERQLAPEKANNYADLVKLDADGTEAWRQPMGAMIQDLFVRPDGDLLLIRSWITGNSAAPNGFDFDNYLLCYSPDGEWQWSYIDPEIGNFWMLYQDDIQNIYITTSAPARHKTGGIVSLDLNGKHRWSLPAEIGGYTAITFSPDKTMIVAGHDSVIAYRDKAGGD